MLSFGARRRTAARKRTSSTTATTSGGTTSGSACVVSPEETIGPYPDQTGMLNNPAYYRQDVTEGKAGVPLTLKLSVVDVATCRAIKGAAVDIWHCDAAGAYSGVTGGGGAGRARPASRR